MAALGSSSMADRIQRSRAKGWRMPAGAIYVGRPTKWGNQFKVIECARLGWEVFKCTDGRFGGAPVGHYPTKAEALAAAVAHHQNLILGPEGVLLRRRAQV